MNAPAQVLLLGGVLALSSLALGGMAWRSVSQERQAAELRYRERGEAALDAAERALLEAARQAPPLVEWVAPLVSESRAEAPAAFLAELEALESRGEVPSKPSPLLGRVLSEATPGERAAALSVWAGALARGGQAEAAQAAWEEVVSLGAEHRDRRGLRRDLSARYFLARDVTQRLDLLEELSRDYRGWGAGEGLAAGVLWRRVALELAAALPEELEGVSGPPALRPAPLLTEGERERLTAHLLEEERRALARRARWSELSGVEDWARGAAPGAVACFEFPCDPTREAPAERRVLVSQAEGQLRFAPLDSVVAQGLAAPELGAFEQLGFEIRPLRSSQGVGGAEGDPLEQQITQRVLGEPFAGVELRVFGSELDTFVASEARRLKTTFAALAVVLTLVVLGIALLLRSVWREAEVARAQRNFVAAVTHELKTPLASIRLLGELLADGGVEPAKAQDFAERVVRETDRLTGLVETVLQLARSERAAHERVSLEPRELAESAAEAARLLCDEEGVELVLELEGDAPAIRGDREALVRTLINLLDNARKYGAGPLTLSTLSGEGKVCFVVSDAGAGVPEAQREQIFEAFWRGGDELTRSRPGVGLGLALGRAVAEAHEGQLRCEAAPEGGAQFVLSVPAVKAGQL